MSVCLKRLLLMSHLTRNMRVIIRHWASEPPSGSS